MQIQTMILKKVQYNVAALEPTSWRGSMNSSAQHSADGAPHEHQVKAESLIQQKDENSHKSKTREWPPACTTDGKFLDKLKGRTQETERNAHREEEVLAEDRRQRASTILERFSHRRERDEDRRPAGDAGRPNDHAATRGRDVSLRQEGGHSPEYRTVVWETTGTARAVDESPRPEKEAEHVVLTCSAEVPEPPPRTDDHALALC